MTGLFPPRCAAKFRPEAPLASGGQGLIWRAVQIELQRPVALKLLSRQSLANADTVQRFLNEARIAAALRHLHVVQVLDHDVEDGVPWIAYELLPGPDLRAALNDRLRLPWPDALSITAQIASALDAAHHAGILHRDVKPENILHADPTIVKVTDFGIAKWSQSDFQTGQGLALGTVAYMAPEIIQGQGATPASDLYALGILLHELLTGRTPFEGLEPTEHFLAHIKIVPPPGSDQVALPPPAAAPTSIRGARSWSTRAMRLDAGAFIGLERRDPVMVHLARRLAEKATPLVTSAGVVAEVWRGGPDAQVPVAFLLRRTRVADLTQAVAKTRGRTLGATGTSDPVDAHIVLLAREHGWPVISSGAGDLLAIDPTLEGQAI